MLPNSSSGQNDAGLEPTQRFAQEPHNTAGSSWKQAGPLLTGKDVLLMAAGFLLCLVIAYTFGRNRIFWEDEMLGWMLLHDPSWSHMITAWKLGADGGGFTFYLLGRAWFAVFGASDLSFRLLSASCFGAAFCVTWVGARRYYSISPVTFALFNMWFFSPPMVMHMAEGRFYGLLVLSTSLVIWLVLTKSQTGEQGRVHTPASLYCLTFLCHGLLTTSHILGILYSAALLLALIVLDLQAGRVRIALYLSAACSWSLLLLERSAIRASAHVGQPWFWTRSPNLKRFLGAFTGFSNEIAILLIVLGLLLILSWNGQAKQIASAFARGFNQRRPVYLVVAALAIVPVGMTVEAHFGTSLFIDRYLLPVNIGLALLTMEAFSLVYWRRFFPGSHWSPLSYRGRALAMGSFAVLLFVWVFFHLRYQTIQSPNYTDRLTARLPRGIPVLCEDAWAFTEIIGREHNSGVLYTYLLDWPQSVSRTAPRLEVTQYHLMENWKKVGYFSGSIQPRDAFLQRYQKFLVLQRQETPTDKYGRMIGNPLVDRFAHTPGYQVQRFSRGDVKDREDPNIWLVCRGSCAG